MRPSSRTRQPKQTRLTFTSLPSSSPASARAVKEHGQRSYASVGYEGGARKKRRLGDDLDDIPALPTPDHSSRIRAFNFATSSVNTSNEFDSSSSSESEVLPTGKRRRNARQNKLDFSNHIGGRQSNSDDEESNDMGLPTSSRAHDVGAGIFGTQHKRQKVISSEESSEDELHSSSRFTRTQPKSSPAKRTRNARAEKAFKSSPLVRTTRSSRRLHMLVEPSSAESDEEAEVEKAKGKRSSSTVDFGLDFGEPETSGDDVPALRSSTAKKSRRTTQKAETYIELSSSENGSEIPTRVATNRNAIRFGRRSRRQQTETEEDESEVEESTPARRRLKQRPREIDKQEQQDLDEDLDFLRSSPPQISQSSRAKKPDPRKEALEALKRKRAGQSAAPSSSAIIPMHEGNHVTISDDEEQTNDDDVSSFDEIDTLPPQTVRGIFREDDEDRAFIAEDDPNDTIGAPVDAEMPLWASNYSRMKGKELFKYAVEWMVQKKLNPAFAMDDDIYKLAFKKLDDEVKGLAGSKFKSSVWARDFMVSLEGRPEVVLTEASGLDAELLSEKCQACNRSGHPATFDIQFLGRPYHIDTLEPVEDEEDDDDDDAGDDDEVQGKYDSKDRDIPPASRIYHVGRFCKDNAITAHALEHWRFHLFEWVVLELEAKKHLRPSKIVERDSWSIKKRREYANKVVDGMHESGKITQLYKDFRNEIDAAREKKSGWRGIGAS